MSYNFTVQDNSRVMMQKASHSGNSDEKKNSADAGNVQTKSSIKNARPIHRHSSLNPKYLNGREVLKNIPEEQKVDGSRNKMNL